MICINSSSWESPQTRLDLPQSLEEATCCQKLEEFGGNHPNFHHLATWKDAGEPLASRTGVCAWSRGTECAQEPRGQSQGGIPWKYPSAPNTEPWHCQPIWEGLEASLAAINGFHSYRWKAGDPSCAGGGGKKEGKGGKSHHACPDMAKGTRR